jgi:Flp pilus assembly protein TadG
MSALLKYRPVQLRAEEGAAAVEFALTIAVMISLIIGMMEAGLALFNLHIISESARAGARYAMVRGDTCTVSGVSCTATTTQIQNYVKGLEYPGIITSNMTVTVTYSAYPSGTSCTPNSNCANPGDLVTVKVSYPFVWSIPFVPSSSIPLNSTSAVIISQ